MNTFKIFKLLAPRYYDILEIAEHIPIEVQPDCPCDTIRLTTLCTLIGNNGKSKMQIGVCQKCGYVGYIDRPSGSWMKNYYSSIWDSGKESKSRIEKEVAQYTAKTGSLNPVGLSEEEVMKLGISTDRYLLGIGSGRDLVPNALMRLGYRNIITVDPSKHRALISARVLGIHVVPHPFESSEAQDEFRKHAPFGLIFSSHVLEHTYNPGEIIRLASSLQSDGDYLALALPNVYCERVGTILLYFPHLHSFTPDSLSNLLESSGYELIKRSPPSGNHFVLAKKVKKKAGRVPTIKKEHFQSTVTRFVKEMGLDTTHAATRRLWWWFKYIEYGGQRALWSKIWPAPLFQYYAYSKILFRRYFGRELSASLGKKFSARPIHFSTIMGATIIDVEKRYTTQEESPIEIQFDGNIKLWYK